MFLKIPFQSTPELQNIVLVTNTVLLIVALIIFELKYADLSKTEKRHLQLFYPFVSIFFVIFMYAVYRQVNGG